MNHWETGKMADARIYKPGDLPERCTETRSFRPRVKRLYVWICKIDRGIDFADLFVYGSFSDNGSERSLSFCMHFIIFLMTAGKIMVGSKSFLAALYLI